MKLMHISDLHIGKNLNGYSLIEDQDYILKKILIIIDEESIEGVIIAGDVYDKSVPSLEAVTLFDDFLSSLVKRNLEIFIISGNHDSPERIAFGSRIMKNMKVHVSPVFNGITEPIVINDKFGELNFYLLPFIKPVHVRKKLDVEINSYTDAVEVVIDKMNVDYEQRNILVTHQFVTGGVRSLSEEISVGGSDNVNVDVMSKFDYVALGHLHAPQKMGFDHIRYSGSPLKFSLSEVNHKKCVLIIDIKEKGELLIDEKELIPKRELILIKDKYLTITAKSFYEKLDKESYVYVVLTDEDVVINALEKLRVIYPNILQLEYDNKRTQNQRELSEIVVTNKSPMELFSEFYLRQNNQSLNSDQDKYVSNLIEEVWGELE